MTLKLFPTKEYHLKSHCTKAELIKSINENVMVPVDNMFRQIARISDERNGIRRYFEGNVSEDDFAINHKSYHYASPSAGLSFMPQIYGSIAETKQGTDIKLVFTCPTPPVILLMFFVPMLIIGGIFFSGGMRIFGASICMSFFVFQLVYYRSRIKDDKEQLKLIFKAEEAEQSS